jgi:hypothetical protein
MLLFSSHKCRVTLLFVSLFLLSLNSQAQEPPVSAEKTVYQQLKSFALSGVVEVKGLVIKRDRTQITLDGSVYLAQPIGGKVTGAVFIGDGQFAVETPPGQFEKANLKRLLGVETLESDFKTAVFRFTDDTGPLFGQARESAPNERAQKLASEADLRLLRETGTNLSARLALSILNGESPGLFFATFDGGKRGRFSYVLDHQSRIPVSGFTVNGGEKGLIWAYNSAIMSTEVWLAFYSLEDYKRGQVEYSDVSDLLDVTNYTMEIDLREHSKHLRLTAKASAKILQNNVRAINFKVGESLSEYEGQRLKKQMRVKSVRLGTTELAVVQEDWEGGFTVFLPEKRAAGDKVEFDLNLQGDFMYDSDVVNDCHYPRQNESWFPRHGYLDRATFNLTYRYPKRLKIASVGGLLSEQPDPEDKDAVVSKFHMPQPVALVTFALGPFQKHKDMVKWEKGNPPTPLEFHSLSGSYAVIKEDFILAELNNSVRYFTALFGEYPYPAFGAAFHPFGFGQGFPSLLMMPPADRANKHTYAFIAHETAHQWWGNIVAWRSYRDQWLSEGFAEYSGILYTGLRESQGAKDELLSDLRTSLRAPPVTTTGIGKGRLVDIGPIILGHRLQSSKSFNAYQALIYNKGALVLRMLHFLLSNPVTGDGKPFFDMMTDFVARYRNDIASTDDFRLVVNEHFAKTGIAQKYQMKDLDWLFSQAVYQTELPIYEMQYKLTDEPDGKVMLSGTITQQNVPDDWVMVLPVILSFGNKQEARGTVVAQGPSAPFQIRLPMRPKKVELDPEHWILSERTSTKGN